MNFDTNQISSPSLDKAVLAYKKEQFDQAESECSRFLQETPNNANAMYLFGLILQKQGKNDLAIDYINKAIATDASQIASFQATLSAPIEEETDLSPESDQEDDPFKATRELLKRFEQEQRSTTEKTDSYNIDESPFSINPPSNQSISLSKGNADLLPFIQQLYADNFSAVILFWPGVDSSTIGNLNQFPGMKFCIRHDERKSHEYYTEFLKDLKLRSMSIVTDEKIMQTDYDAFIIPHASINDIEDPIQALSYKTLFIANDFINAPDRQILEETLKSKGCVQKDDQPNVFERKDQLANGEKLFAEGKVDEAVQCFEKVLAQDPNNTDAHNNLGVISYAVGNMESAEIFFLKTLEINPNHVNALMNIADVYTASGHINEAAKYLTKAVDLEPKKPEVWASLSSFYQRIGSNEEAEAAKQKSESLMQNQQD
jgi:tetratricopeptide (TPR) repeat protein